MLKSINPYTLKKIADVDEMTDREVDDIVLKTYEAQLRWRKIDISDRTRSIERLGRVLRDNAIDCAKLMAVEMGKPVRQGKSEIEKCALLCEYYSNKSVEFLQPQVVQSDARKSYIAFEPLGIIFGVMPWNFPFWQVFRFAVPSLALGNAILLKHASNISQCALKIEEIFTKAGFLPDIFHTLLIGKSKVDRVIENPRVSAVTLTGSVAAGRAVAKKAGEQLKKSVLELGGSDAYIVFGDADIAMAAEVSVKSRMINSGQSCIAAKRFIVVETVRQKFEELVVERMKEQKMGDPLDDKSDIGPMAQITLRDQLHEQVRESIDRGAKLLLGGEIPKHKGAFYPPTVLSEVSKGMPAYEQELFGPVAVIIAARDEKDAIQIANDSDFGLGACLFTADIEKGEKMARHDIEAGSCFVNNFVRSDPRLPFGGIKKSGYGRELSRFGLWEFANIKTIFIDHSSDR